MAPLPLIPLPLKNSKFTLNIFGVAGFFGGDEVVEAMSTLHLYNGRKWRGWYNSPGTYTVAKSFGRIANSRFWRGLFPGTCQDPATAFGLDGKKGPKYVAVLSGTELRTGHIGYLLEEYVKSQKARNVPDNHPDHRTAKTTAVTVIDIASVQELNNLSKPSTLLHLFLSYFTMITSVACSIFSLILFNDRFCFAAILLGTIIGGTSSVLIGMGDLSLKSVFRPAPGSPPGDGVLVGEEIIVLRGAEENVNAITKGRFHLHLAGHPTYHIIGVCSMLYFLQFIAQLLLIPQGNLAGQLMFLASFAIAWANNCVHASIDKEVVQMDLLRQSVNMTIERYELPSRTQATLFTCLALHPLLRGPTDDEGPGPEYGDFNPQRLLKSLIPNDTTVWKAWREVVTEALQATQPREHLNKVVRYLKSLSSASNQWELLTPAEVVPYLASLGLRLDQIELLTTLVDNAGVAYETYQTKTPAEVSMKQSTSLLNLDDKI